MARAVRVECQSWLPYWRPERDYRESYSARADEGGVLRDLVHELDYAIWAFGGPVGRRPRSVRAVRATRCSASRPRRAADLLWTSGDGTR